MLRPLLLLIAIVVLAWLVRRALLIRRRHDSEGRASQLVPCSHCGMLLPQAEAHAFGSRYYCSPQHARSGPRND